jgi:hypothetical protein
MTSKIKDQIAIQTRSKLRLAQILNHLRLDVDEENPVLKTRDVNNHRSLLRDQSLRVRKLTQALLRELTDKKKH